MPRISIVVVNYNVTHFLELCLHAIFRASEGISVEVVVVDNNSIDGSCEMVESMFPSVRLIRNHDNPGFGKANNQAVRVTTGEFVLFLNPDTIIAESTLHDCLAFMDSHADAGALGVHMIDGSGRYLRESKRALPTPMVSFYKIFGLSALFPRSKVFAQYHLGFLDKDQIHPVNILSGAFMFIRRRVLDEIGLFDEQFFMYGEDIDLSYRVLQSGYRNYYLGGTKIIHFKGESTKKGSLNYVVVFYKAMEIFARKHFTGHGFTPMRIAIEAAIWFRAFMAMGMRMFAYLFLPKSSFQKQSKRGKGDLSRSSAAVAIVADNVMVGVLSQDKELFGGCSTVLFVDVESIRTRPNEPIVIVPRPNKVVLCMEALSNTEIVALTEKLGRKGLRIEMLGPNRTALVGSGSSK